MSVMMVLAWVITVGLRRIAVRLDVLRHVWDLSAFVAAVFVIVHGSKPVLAPFIGCVSLRRSDIA